MINGGPSRTFTREAVDSWLLKLARANWEPQFEQSTLDSGRELYRQGAITAIDLQLDQAIVSRKIERKETYSVIEWSNGKPAMRFSTSGLGTGECHRNRRTIRNRGIGERGTSASSDPEEEGAAKSHEKETSKVESPRNRTSRGKS